MSKLKLNITAEAQNGKAVIRIDGNISSWSNNAQSFKAALDNLIANGITDAVIYINSGGGSCFEANEIANEILRFTGAKTAIIGALCASAATYIACKCDSVVAATNMLYMIHKPMVSADGNSDELKSVLKALEILQADYAKTYSDKTGLPIAKIEKMWTSDYWMSSLEAKALGFIDSIEGDAEITPQDILSLEASGYKNMPKITATIQPKNEVIPMKNLLITVLALSATISDNEVIAQVELLKSKAAKADDFEAKLKLAEAKLKEVTDKAVKESIDAVIAEGEKNKQITPATTAFFRKSLEADFESAKAAIKALPVATKLSDVPEGEGKGEDTSKWTYADYQDKDPKALAKMAEDDEAKFQKLFDAHYNTK